MATESGGQARDVDGWGLPSTAGFHRRGGELCCDDVPLRDLADRFGTPLHVYSRAALEGRFQAYRRAFAPVRHRVCYALKANASGALLQVLSRLGAGADVVSGFELLAARRAGFDPATIVFAGVGKTEAELSLALEHGIGEINAESAEEVELIAAAARRLGRTARVALRVNPDIDARSHPYISTGLRESKFGIDVPRALRIVEAFKGRPDVRIVGLQCHIGSQITDLGPLEAAARELGALTARLLAEGHPLETVDLGGGLGIPYDGSPGAAPADFAARVLPHVASLPVMLLLEPGRSLVGPAGVLLTRVLYRKENHGKRFVIVDAGMTDLVRPALYEAFHRIEPVIPAGAPAETVDVVGPVCETGDFLALARELEAVQPGDVLAVRDTGAYGFCMASNYNMRPRAAEVLVESPAPRLIRRRERFEDLVATEV